MYLSDVLIYTLYGNINKPVQLMCMQAMCSYSGAAQLQALVCDILPSTTGVFNYAKGSANEQFFVGVQTVVSLLQTTQITSDVCFITDHVAYVSSNITKTI